MEQLAGGQLPEAAPPFVVRVIDVEVLTRHVQSRLAAEEKPGEADTHVLASPFADHQRIAHGAAGLIDQSGSGGPVGVVKSSLMQCREDAIEAIQWIHHTCS